MRREDDRYDTHEVPELDAEDRELVAKLRALPPDGDEPDWAKLEAAIRADVGDRAPSPWWRNWRWIVPVWALTTTAAVALIVTRDSGDDHRQAATTRATIDAGVERDDYREQANALWLDGEMLELDDVEAPELDELDLDARAALEAEPDVSGGILPVTDYGWIDTLDDDAAARAEHWLTRKRS